MSSASPEVVTRRAYAKINVFLRVLGRRDDGFHDLESVVLPISLHDVVTVRARPEPGVDVQVSGDDGSAEGVPNDAENLAARAAEAWAASRGEALGVDIAIDKRVPVAAGLGGGSADAAATLAALDELRDGSVSEARELAAELGSDVPALLAGGPVLARGRGELVTPVHAAVTWWVLKPFDFPVTASDAYRWWDDEPSTGPDAGVLIAALETGDVDLLGDALFNDLQAPVAARHREVAGAIDALLGAGALGAVMSGSGPTVAALARHVGHADSLASAVEGAIVVSGPPESHRHDEG